MKNSSVQVRLLEFNNRSFIAQFARIKGMMMTLTQSWCYALDIANFGKRWQQLEGDFSIFGSLRNYYVIRTSQRHGNIFIEFETQITRKNCPGYIFTGGMLFIPDLTVEEVKPCVQPQKGFIWSVFEKFMDDPVAYRLPTRYQRIIRSGYASGPNWNKIFKISWSWSGPSFSNSSWSWFNSALEFSKNSGPYPSRF